MAPSRTWRRFMPRTELGNGRGQGTRWGMDRRVLEVMMKMYMLCMPGTYVCRRDAVASGRHHLDFK